MLTSRKIEAHNAREGYYFEGSSIVMYGFSPAQTTDRGKVADAAMLRLAEAAPTEEQ